MRKLFQGHGDRVLIPVKLLDRRVAGGQSPGVHVAVCRPDLTWVNERRPGAPILVT